MKTIPEILTRLAQARKEVAEKQSKQKAAASVCCDVACEASPTDQIATLQSQLNYFDNRFQYVWESINELRGALYEHCSDGHLPKIEGATAMSKALKALGLDGDYEVVKQTVYASTGEVQSERFILTKTAK